MELDRDGPFLLSPRDDLIGVGWNVKSSVLYQVKPYPNLLSCTSNSPFRIIGPNGSCSGLGFCKVALPPPWPTMPVIETAVILEVKDDTGTSWKTNPCSYVCKCQSILWRRRLRVQVPGALPWQPLYHQWMPTLVSN
jgi:hypothetical protein